jgi:hypothetical protein
VGEVQKGLVNYGGSVGIKRLAARKWQIEAFEHNMPSAASSFLLLPAFIERLRFVATKKMTLLSGNPDDFGFIP